MKTVTFVKDWLQFFAVPGNKTTNATILADIEVKRIQTDRAEPSRRDLIDGVPTRKLKKTSSNNRRSEKRQRVEESETSEKENEPGRHNNSESPKDRKASLEVHYVLNKVQKQEQRQWIEQWRHRGFPYFVLDDQPGDSNNELSILSETQRPSKPILVLDLDQTLIDSTPKPRVASSLLRTSNIKKGFTIYSGVHIMVVEGVTYYVKFRPYLQPFLQSLHKHFELHLYTHSRRVLAEAVLNLMGDEGKLFTRIVTREDVPTTKRKSLSFLTIPKEDQDSRFASAFIVDDNAKNVWGVSLPNTTKLATTTHDNLIQIRPFVYFARERKPGKSKVSEDWWTKMGLGECGEKDEELLAVYDLLVSTCIENII